MKENLELNELNSRLLEIINECKSEEGIKKLQAIYDTLNENNALQVVRLVEKIKHFFRNLSATYRKEMLQKRIDTAKSEALGAIKEYIFTEDMMKKSTGEIKDIPSDLARSINRLLDISLGVEFSEETIKRYPIELTDNIKSQEYSKARLEMSKSYLDGKTSVKEVIEKTKKQYIQRQRDIEDKSIDLEIEPYYGTKEFMEYRIKHIKKCMENMLKSERFNGRNDISNGIDIINKVLIIYEKTSLKDDSIDRQKNKYKNLENSYKFVLKMENALAPEVAEVWIQKLSLIEAYRKDGNFAFLAYALKEGEFDPKNMNKLPMQYITQDTITLDGEYGLIYTPNTENLFSMSSGKAKEWTISKEDFINSRIFKGLSIYRAY